MNRIDQIHIDLEGSNQPFFQHLMGGWENVMQRNLHDVLDRLLQKYDSPTTEIEINTLAIHLGDFTEEDFKTEFLKRLSDEVEQALKDQLKKSYNDSNIVIKKKEKDDWELLVFYLKTGIWDTKLKTSTPTQMLAEFIKTDPQRVWALLVDNKYNTFLVKRFALQVNATQFWDLIRLQSSEIEDIRGIFSQLVEIITTNQKDSSISRATLKKHLVTWLLSNPLKSKQDQEKCIQFLVQSLLQESSIAPAELITLLSTNSFEGSSTRLLQNTQAIPFLERKGRELDLFDVHSPLNAQKQWMEEHPVLTRTYLELGIISFAQFVNCTIDARERNWFGELITVVERVFKGDFTRGQVEKMAVQLLQNEVISLSQHRSFCQAFLQQMKFVKSVSAAQIRYFIGEVKQKQLLTTQNVELLLKEEWTGKIFIANLSDLQYWIKEPNFASPSLIERLNRDMHQHQQWEHWIKQLSEKENKRVVHLFYPMYGNFIVESIGLMHWVPTSQTEEEERQLRYNSSNALQWVFVHRVLKNIAGIGFNKKNYVIGVLKQVANHYNLTMQVWLETLFHQRRVLADHLSLEVITLLQDIYHEQVTIINHSIRSKRIQEFKVKFSGLVPKGNLDLKPSYVELLQLLEVELQFIQQLLQDVQKHYRWSTYKADEVIRLLWNKGIQNTLDTGAYTKKQALWLWIQIVVQEVKNEHKEPERVEQLVKQNKYYPDVKKIIADGTKNLNTMDMNVETELHDQNYFVSNAGVILLAPYLPRLFSILGLMEDGAFKSDEARFKAIFLIQYAVWNHIEFEEYELLLNKVLVGLPIAAPIPRQVQLTEEDKEVVDGLLSSVTQHWAKVTTLDGLREGFLQRDGALTITESTYQLTPEPKAYDVLLDSLPWSYKTTQLSWMDKPIITNWR